MILLAYAPAILALIGGIWAVQRIRRPELRDRPDRSAAIGIAAAVAAVAGLGVGWLGGLSAVIFSGSEPNVAVGLAYGVVGGACFGLAGILGYALLARPRVGAVAVAGALLGPIVLIVSTILTSSVASSFDLAELEKAVEQHNAEVAARSTAIHVTVDGVDVETARDGAVIAAVNLRLRLTSDVAVSLETGYPAPCFTLFPPDRDAAEALQVCARTGSPTRFAAGKSYEYSSWLRYTQDLINETQGTYRAGPPGTWMLRTDFLDAAGQEYDVWQPVELR